MCLIVSHLWRSDAENVRKKKKIMLLLFRRLASLWIKSPGHTLEYTTLTSAVSAVLDRGNITRKKKKFTTDGTKKDTASSLISIFIYVTTA